MTELPDGVVTFLFTDIEGSTRLLERDPEASAVAIARHHEPLADVVQRHRGVVFETVGDAAIRAGRPERPVWATSVRAVGETGLSDRSGEARWLELMAIGARASLDDLISMALGEAGRTTDDAAPVSGPAAPRR